LGAMIILYVGSEMGITYWAVMYLVGSLSLGTVVASSFVTSFWVAITVGRLGVSWAARKIGDERLLFILAAGSVVSYGIFLAAGVGWAAGIALAAVGLSFSGIFPTLIGLGVNRFPRAPGTINSFLLAFMGSGVLIFPYLVGQIAERYSLFVGMIGILSVMVLLTCLAGVLAFVKRRK
jgi:fucose permease